MQKKKKNGIQMDMLHGSMVGKMILFSLPLALSSILQQLFNSADVAVVGRFAGSQALAAVGANVANVGIFVNLLVGCSTGPNVLIANLIGQKKDDEVSDVVHTVVAFSVVGGIGLAILGLLLSAPMLILTGTPEDVLDMALIYLRVYMLGLPAIMMYNFCSAILRSVGDTKRPLYCMLISGVVNVILNLVFVIACHLGVLGVAVSTVISNYLSAGLLIGILAREEGMIKLELSRIKIHGNYLKRMLQIGLPAGIQSTVFSLSNIFVQSGINSFGAPAIAGSSAALNFEYFTYDISAAFAQGAITFSSQNYGAMQYDRCKKIFWIAMLEGMGFTALLSLVFTIWARPFVSLYTIDERVIAFALLRMYCVMSLEALTETYEVAAASLRSIGYAMVPAVMTIIGTVGFRMLWICTIFKKIHTFEMLMLVYPVSWIFTAAMVVSAYFILRKKRGL